MGWNDHIIIRYRTSEESFGRRVTAYYSTLDAIYGRDGTHFERIEAGWPLKCVETQSRYPRPIFPGFIANTIIYAAIWFGFLSFVMLILRRFWSYVLKSNRSERMRRGWCPLCSYDLRGRFDSGCSECGWQREATRSNRETGRT